MRYLCALLFVTGCIPGLPEVSDPCAVWDEPGLYQYKTEYDGKTRKPLIYVPASEGPRDMVVVLHGAAQSAAKMRELTGHINLSNKRGNVTVYPNGLKTWFWRGWNAGDCCTAAQEDGRDVDDLGYLEHLVEELSPQVCTDKVLATGFSNGAMMAQRWACEGTALDAIVPAAGPLMTNLEKCRTGPPVPIRAYHGLVDDVVPVKGGGLENYTSEEKSMGVWRDRNQCQGEGVTFSLDEQVECTAWDCAVPTELCLIKGWAHQWPGGLNAARLSGSNATIDGYEFFLMATGRQESDTSSD